MPIKKMQDLDLTGKTVVIREDLNVPMEGLGILASLPTSPAAEDARRVTRLLTELQA